MRLVDFGNPYGVKSFPDDYTDEQIVAEHDRLESDRKRLADRSRMQLVRQVDINEERGRSYIPEQIALGADIGAYAAPIAAGNVIRAFAPTASEIFNQGRQVVPEGFKGPDELAVGPGGTVSGIGFNPQTFRTIARGLVDYGRAGQERAREESEQLGGSIPSRIAGSLAETAVVSAQTLPFATLGLGPAAIAASLQQYGLTREQFRDQLQRQNPGLSEEEAYAQAETPAVLSGAATGLLTRTFGGTERFIQNIVQNGLNREGIKGLLKEAVRSAELEFPEEMLDQAAQGYAEKAYINPDKTHAEIWNEAVMAGGAGALLGLQNTATIGGIGQIARAVDDRVTLPRRLREAAIERRRSVISRAMDRGDIPTGVTPNAETPREVVNAPGQEERLRQEEAERLRLRNPPQDRMEAEARAITPGVTPNETQVLDAATTPAGVQEDGTDRPSPPGQPSARPADSQGGGAPGAGGTATVQAAVANVVSRWQSAPPVQVVTSPQELPADVREDAAAAGHDLGTVAGARDRSGRVWIVSDNITDANHARRVLLEEAVGHYGVRAVLGDRFDAFMQGVADRHAATPLGQEVRSIYGDDAVTVGKEVVGKLAQNPEADPTLWQNIVATVRDYIRRIFDLNISDNDIRVLLAKSARSLESGAVAATSTASDFNAAPQRIPVKIKQPDGTIVDGEFTGYYDMTQYGKGILISAGWKLPDGNMTHGMLKPGWEIIGDIPTFDQWKAGQSTGSSDFSINQSPQFFKTRKQVNAAVADPALSPAAVQVNKDLAAVQASMVSDPIKTWLLEDPMTDAQAHGQKRLSYLNERQYLQDTAKWLASLPETTDEERQAKEVAGAMVLGHYGLDRSVEYSLKSDIEKDLEAMPEAMKKASKMNVAQMKANFLTAMFNHMVVDYRKYLENLTKAAPAAQNLQAQWREGLATAERRLNDQEVSPIALQRALSALAVTLPDNLLLPGTTQQQIVTWALNNGALQTVVGQDVIDWMLVDDGTGSPAMLGYNRLVSDLATLREVLNNQAKIKQDIDAFEQWFSPTGKTGKVPVKRLAENYFKFRTGRDAALKVARAIEREIDAIDTRIHGNQMALDLLQSMMTSKDYVDTVTLASERAHVVVRALHDSPATKTGNGLIDRDSNVGQWRMKGPITDTVYTVDLHPSTAIEQQNRLALSSFVIEARDYASQHAQDNPLLAKEYGDLADYIVRYLLNPSLDPAQGFVQMPWGQIPGTTIRFTVDPFDLLSHGLTAISFTNRTVRDSIERIGGRTMRQVMSDAYELDRVMRKVQGLESNPKFGFDAQTKAVITAVKSHGWTMDQFGRWDEFVSEKIIASGQNNLGGKYEVGDVIVGSEGVKVTSADIAAVKLMKQFADAVLAAAPPHVQEQLGTLGIQRKAVGSGRYTMARLGIIGPRDWAVRLVGDWDTMDDTAKLKLLDNGLDFQRIVMGYMGEFNPEFKKMSAGSKTKTPLFEIYRKLAGTEKIGIQIFHKLDEVLDFIANEMVARQMAPDFATARTNAQATLLSEINGFIKAFETNVLNLKNEAVWNGKPDPIATIVSANNSFTTARGELQAPSTFYQYSLATDGRRRGYVGGLRSLLNLKVIQSMREAKHAMEKKKGEFNAEIEKQVNAGISKRKATKGVVNQSQKERRAGKIRYDYRELDAAIRYLSSVLEQMERVELQQPDHYQHPGIEAMNNAAGTLKSGLLMAPNAIVTNTFGGLLLGPAVLHWQTGQYLRAIRDVAPFFIGGNTRITGTVLKMAASIVADNPIMSKLLKKHAPLWNSLSNIILEAAADWADVQKTAQMNGMVQPYNLMQRWSNQAELKGGAGRFVNDDDPGAVATAVNAILSAPGIRHLLEPIKAAFPRKFDDFINYSLILGFDKDLDMLKKRGWVAFKKREQSAIPGHDWKNLTDPINVLTPEDVKLGSFKDLNRWQEIFAPLGSLDAVLLDYYERTKSMTPEQREAEPLILDENEYAGMALYYAGVSNVATESNRPHSYRGKGAEGFLRGAAGTFAGWGANFMHQLSKGLQTYSKDSQYKRIQNNMIGLATIIVLLVAVGAWNWEAGDELNKFVTGQSSARIQVKSAIEDIKNVDQDPVAAMGYFAQALPNSVPWLGNIIGSMAGVAFTGRGNALDVTSQILYANVISKTWDTIKRIKQTGDVVLPLADWTRSFVVPPVSKAILNRLPTLRGLVDQQNAIRSMNGSAPPGTEIKWGQGGGGSIKYGPANDEIQKLIGSAYDAVAHGGTVETVRERLNDAINAFVATGRSQPDAIKAVSAALAAKEPVRILTGREMTPEEASRWVARMTPSQKADYDRAVEAWKLLGAVTGKDLDMVSTSRVGGSGGGGGRSGTIAGLPSQLGGGMRLQSQLERPSSRLRGSRLSGAGAYAMPASLGGVRRSTGRSATRRLRTRRPRRMATRRLRSPRLAGSSTRRRRSVGGTRRRRYAVA